MKTLNEYIIEGLLNKDSIKEKVKVIDNKNFLRKFVNPSMEYLEQGYIFIYSLEQKFSDGGIQLFDIKSTQKNKFALDFKYKSANSSERSLVIRPKKEIYDLIDSDYPNGWSLEKINATEQLNVSFVLQSWDSFTTSSNIDANNFEKGIPKKLTGKINYAEIINTGYSKAYILQNFSIESSSSIIFKNKYAYSGFKFKNCNIKTPKRIIFVEGNSSAKTRFSSNSNVNYCLNKYSNNMINNFSGFNCKCDILEFIPGVIYKDIYSISKDNIPFGYDNSIRSTNIWNNGVFPDQNSNYLLETAIVWLLPMAIYLKPLQGKKSYTSFGIDSTKEKTLEYSISELLEVIPNTGKNYEAVQLFEKFVQIFGTNVKQIRFVNERGRYTSIYGNVYTLVYDTVSKKLSMLSTQNAYLRYKNLLHNYYSMVDKVDDYLF